MRAARLAAPLLAAGLALAAASCGSASDRSGRAFPPVRLTVTAPLDSQTTQGSSVTVRGSVDPPDASVQVGGQPAEVLAGSFTAQVDLDPGSNVIDLAATAPRRGPALTAIRVTRELPVIVPDLSGLSTRDAQAALRPLGLRLVAKESGSLLEKILPGDPSVCEQTPGSGDQARRGSTVHVKTAKSC
jgi:hypothetical protein